MHNSQRSNILTPKCKSPVGVKTRQQPLIEEDFTLVVMYEVIMSTKEVISLRARKWGYRRLIIDA